MRFLEFPKFVRPGKTTLLRLSANATEAQGRMARYFARSCPKCNGYLGIVLPHKQRNVPVKAINGRCVKCGHRLAWLLVLGKRLARYSVRKAQSQIGVV
jgi:hypothetical protein